MYGILRDTSALRVSVGLRIFAHCVVLHILEVGDERVEHGIERRSRQIHLLRVVEVSLGCEGHVAIGADEVEIAEVAQCRHLGNGGTQFALRVVGILLGNRGCKMNDGVAVVDHLIKTRPVGEAV